MQPNHTKTSGLMKPSDDSLSLASKFRHIPNFSKFWENAQAENHEFDWQFYLDYYRDLQRLRTPQDAYEHWILFGQIEGRIPNQTLLKTYIELEYHDLPEDFDPEGYWVLNPELRAKFSKTECGKLKAIEHFMRYGRHEFKEYKSAFDWKFYIEFNQDLSNLIDYQAAYDHWIATGCEEGRFSSKAELIGFIERKLSELPQDFDYQIYLKLNGDLQQRFNNSKYQEEQAINHFLQHGRAEGRPYRLGVFDLEKVSGDALQVHTALFSSSRFLNQTAGTGRPGFNALIHFAQTEATQNREHFNHLKEDSSFIDEAVAFYQAALQLQVSSAEVLSRLRQPFIEQSKWKSLCGRYHCFDAVYAQWLRENAPALDTIGDMATSISSFSYQPTISVILPVYNTPAAFLREAIDSVIEQIYPYWELCIADDRSTLPHVHPILEEYAAKDSRIKISLRTVNGHISACSNSALAIASGEFVTLLDHDDVITPDALYEVVRLLNQHPDADMIYSDEDKLNERGQLINPYFKPDWCPDAFLSRMYTCHLGTYRRSIIEKIDGFRLGYEGSQDYDLVLRFTELTERIFHIPKILYHWRMHPESTAGSAAAKPYAYKAAVKAIESALQRRGEPGKVIPHSRFPGLHIIRYQLTRPGLVSIIIPTRDLTRMLARCLDSIFIKSTYLNYEVIVIDNGSQEPELANLLLELQNKHSNRFSSYRLDIPFNFSQLNNYAVGKAQGEYLLFLNNDTEVITTDWLESLIEQAQRPSIGAVGPLLIYPDNTVQHAGVVLGIQGVANHGHRHIAAELPGYFGQLATPNNYLALTGACLLCRKEVFLEVGGFDESLAVAYNDVDLCLKMIEKGYHNIYIPHAKLYHHESKSRGYEDSIQKRERLQQESKIFSQRWQKYIENDPCYSINLSRDLEDYSLRFTNKRSVQLLSIIYFDAGLERFRDFAIDDLEAGNIYRNFMLIRGWAFCKQSLVLGIEIMKDSQLLQFISINEIRLDVAHHRPDLPGAECSGFRETLCLADWPSTADLMLQAVLADRTRIPLCLMQLKTVSDIGTEA